VVINGYWYLFYLWLRMVILLVTIGGYFINKHCYLFYYWLLVVILLINIITYSITGYW
jgi:hypothetical protein